MDLLPPTNFDDPEDVLLQFVAAARRFYKRYHFTQARDSAQAEADALKLLHHFTHFKYHPYRYWTHGLDKIKHINAIERVEVLSTKVVNVHTLKNQSAIPACVFTLHRTNKRWRVADAYSKHGGNIRMAIFN